MDKQETLKITAQLQNLQDLDIAIAHNQKELQAIPERQKNAETTLAASKNSLEEARAAAKIKQTAVHGTELEIESMRQQIEKLRMQQFQIKSNTEYKALNKEIEYIEEKISILEDKVLSFMEEVEKLNSLAAVKEKELRSEQEQVNTTVKQMAEAALELQAELESLNQKRAASAVDIPQEWLAIYERIFANKKDFALVGLDGNAVCGGCHMKVPAQVLHDVRGAASLITCVFCGRLLFDNH